MAIVAAVGAILFAVRRPERAVGTHLHDDAEPTAAERHIEHT